MPANIRAIEFHLPDKRLTNVDLAAEFPDWSVAKIEKKTGIEERRLASQEECASDLAVAAAEKLFAAGACRPQEIDYVLLCTQSPDYFLPTTACLLQDRLRIPTSAGALDFNLGCSGFVYGLSLAKGLIETAQATKVLLVTAETYSKFIHPRDKSVRTIFGDAAAATLVQETDHQRNPSGAAMGPFVFGTDGRGAENLIVRTGGMRRPQQAGNSQPYQDFHGNWRTEDNLYMNGPEIFTFTLQSVPDAVHELLKKADKTRDDVDLFVFHQANQYILEHLRKKIRIPKERYCVALRECGNTVSSTIPIALKSAMDTERLRPGDLVMLVGFGVGYSWGAMLLRWPAW